MRRAAKALALTLALASCATVQPIATKPQEAAVPVAVTCVDVVPAAPALLADAEWQRSPPDEFERVRALKIDRSRLIQANNELRATLLACAKGNP